MSEIQAQQKVLPAIPKPIVKKVIKAEAPVLYKSTIPSMKYLFENGVSAIFVAGRYATDIQYQIDELNKEIGEGHPFIFIDENEATVETVEPMEALRAKFYKEFELQQKRALNKDNDAGSYDVPKLIPASSRTVEAAAGASHSGEGAAPAGGIKVGIGAKK